MFDSDQKLRHLPFFDFAAAHDESSPEWREAAAGLVVLRLVDTWLDEGRRVLNDDERGVERVRACIDDVHDGSVIHSLLHRVLDAMQEQDPDIHCIVKPLMAYGRALEFDVHWQLAEDVYQTLLAHLHPVEDSDASIAAHLRLGQCYRNLNRVDDALDAFMSVADIGASTGDLVAVLSARIGEATMAVIRGNIALAERLLDETIARAQGPAMQDVRSRALHDRANVAQRRGNFELGVQLAYQALSQSQSATEKDRIVNDIGLMFMEMGVFSGARDAFLVLAATAQEQYVRWGAMLNLLEIGQRTGARVQFEQARRVLAAADLPPQMATHFELTQGEAYYRFGELAKAQLHLRRALALAGEHNFSELLFDAERALAALDREAPRPEVARLASLDVQEVVEAIREMREYADVM